MTATNNSGKDVSPINVQLQRSGDAILYGMLLTSKDHGPDAKTPGIDGYREIDGYAGGAWRNGVFAAGQTDKFLAVIDCTDKKLKSKTTTLGDKKVTLPISR